MTRRLSFLLLVAVLLTGCQGSGDDKGAPGIRVKGRPAPSSGAVSSGQ